MLQPFSFDENTLAVIGVKNKIVVDNWTVYSAKSFDFDARLFLFV